MSQRRFGFSTTAVHGEPHRRADWSPVVPPLMQSATFVNPVGSSEEVLYTRYGNNPNQVSLARKYALTPIFSELADQFPVTRRARILARSDMNRRRRLTSL